MIKAEILPPSGVEIELEKNQVPFLTQPSLRTVLPTCCTWAGLFIAALSGLAEGASGRESSLSKQIECLLLKRFDFVGLLFVDFEGLKRKRKRK